MKKLLLTAMLLSASAAHAVSPTALNMGIGTNRLVRG